jgi:branched-chain amino acid transport system ATP-binding protein
VIAPSLETRDLTVRFGGHVAVNAVSCAFRPGTLTCIVGPNGAGKTTYFNLISGQIAASNGSILLKGNDITRMPVATRALAGLGRAFQLTNLFPQLSVIENVRLVMQARMGFGLSLLSMWTSHRRAIEDADACVARVALTRRRDTRAAELSHGDQRKLEVAMLLALDPEIFMFDEPTAGMSVDEVPVILDLLRAIKADTSKTILLVEHKMDVVRSLADRIVVLHNGTLLADGTPADVMDLAIVQEAYLGSLPKAGAVAHG